MEKFSRDLALETQHFGVTVQCVLPGFVATNMSRFKSSLTVPSPKQFVRCSMNTLGLEVSSPGYWVHKIQVFPMKSSIFYLKNWKKKTQKQHFFTKFRFFLFNHHFFTLKTEKKHKSNIFFTKFRFFLFNHHFFTLKTEKKTQK